MFDVRIFSEKRANNKYDLTFEGGNHSLTIRDLNVEQIEILGRVLAATIYTTEFKEAKKNETL